MTETVQDIIKTFDCLSADEQKEVVKIILRRNIDIETPELSDEDLVLNAKEIFLELDRREAVDADS